MPGEPLPVKPVGRRDHRWQAIAALARISRAGVVNLRQQTREPPSERR